MCEIFWLRFFGNSKFNREEFELDQVMDKPDGIFFMKEMETNVVLGATIFGNTFFMQEGFCTGRINKMLMHFFIQRLQWKRRD